MEMTEQVTSKQERKGTGRKVNIAYLAKVSILGAIATVLMLFEFPLPFAPGFYALDFSEIPVLIGGFALGPMAGILIEFLKILLNLLINGTMTAGIGEFANFLIGCAFIIPAALFYKYRKGIKNAILAMSIGTVTMTVIGSLVNLFILLPTYSALVMPMDTIIKMGTEINGAITDLATLVLFATAPFNLVKGIAVSVITALLYKHISPILHK